MFQDRAGGGGGHVYGVWASMVGLGLARDEGIAITRWPDTEAANAAQPVADAHCHLLAATVRPDGPPPATFPGLSVFRWFEVAAEDWSAFRDLSAAAWPNMEANFGCKSTAFGAAWNLAAQQLDAAAHPLRRLLGVGGVALVAATDR